MNRTLAPQAAQPPPLDVGEWPHWRPITGIAVSVFDSRGSTVATDTHRMAA